MKLWDRAVLVLSAMVFAMVLSVAAWASIAPFWRVSYLARQARPSREDIAWTIVLVADALLPYLAAAVTLRIRRSRGAPWAEAMLVAALVALVCIGVIFVSMFFVSPVIPDLPR
jgi:hypothetical protein